MNLTATITTYAKRDKSRPISVKIMYEMELGVGYQDTGVKVLEKDWDGTKVKKSDPQHVRKNAVISDEKNKLEAWALDYRIANGKYPDARKLKELYQPDAPKRDNLELLIEKYKAYREQIKTKPQTWEFYQTAFSRLKEFEPDFNPDNCGVAWMYRFESYLYEHEPRRGKKVTSSHTVSNYVVCVTQLLKFLAKSNLTSLSLLDIEAMKIKKGKRHIVKFTDAELQAMCATDFYDEVRFPGISQVNRRNLSLTRDTCLICFYTFLRGVDLNPEKWAWVSVGGDKKVLKVVLQKTEDTTEAVATIHVHPTALEIMARYPETKGVPPIGYSHVKTFVQEMARLSGVTDKVKLIHQRKIFEANAEVEKCDLLGLHSFRGAGMCHAYKNGMSREKIAKQAGINVATLDMSYLSFDEEDIVLESEKVHEAMGRLSFSVNQDKKEVA